MVSRFVKEIPSELLDQKMPKKRFTQEQIVEAAVQSAAHRPVYDYRPKAVLKPKETAPAVKPFIAGTISDLNKVTGISKGMPGVKAGLGYGVGDRVQHIKFGVGSVKNIQDEPRDYKVTVEFDKFGQKVMYASFAKLKKL